MPVPRDHLPASHGAAALARKAGREARHQRLLVGLAADLFHPEEARLDDRTRARARELLAETVAVWERALRVGAARRLTAWGEEEVSERLSASGSSVLNELLDAGVLADPDFAAALVGCTELSRLAGDLPAARHSPERPSLLARLSECPEPAIAEAATAMLAAANMTPATALSDEWAGRLVWWVAAALAARSDEPSLALALAETAEELLVSPPKRDAERVAAALASAIAARPDELPDLLVESLGDRQPALFIAFLAEALELATDEVRSALLDRDSTQLLLCLRAAAVGREAIALMGVALAEADPRRDLERFADLLDEVAALAPAAARAALAPLALPLAFRRARRELQR